MVDTPRAWILLGLLTCGCTGGSSPERVVVFAAMSTRDAMLDIETQFERTSGLELVLNFGSSGDLSHQIIAGARADVFLSADELSMDAVERQGLVTEGSRRDLLGNELVVIVPEDAIASSRPPFQLDQLAHASVHRIALADPRSVPAGRYARAWLESRGLWDEVEQRIVPTVDVRAVLAAVEAGAADAGVVYASDVLTARAVRVVLRVPAADGPRIAYPIAVLKASSRAASSFVLFLETGVARTVFQLHGFLEPPLISMDRDAGRVPEQAK